MASKTPQTDRLGIGVNQIAGEDLASVTRKPTQVKIASQRRARRILSGAWYRRPKAFRGKSTAADQASEEERTSTPSSANPRHARSNSNSLIRQRSRRGERRITSEPVYASLAINSSLFSFDRLRAVPPSFRTSDLARLPALYAKAFDLFTTGARRYPKPSKSTSQRHQPTLRTPVVPDRYTRRHRNFSDLLGTRTSFSDLHSSTAELSSLIKRSRRSSLSRDLSPPLPTIMNTRSSQYLDPASALDPQISTHKFHAIQIAKAQEAAIHEKLKRIGEDIPKYEFLELIGKGAYGRVFKCHDQTNNNRIVALKVIDVDLTDYKENPKAKDDTIESTVHEIKVLKQLSDSKAKNVNMFFDAFQIHSQLWIVNDYCPGGSLHTLMRATGNKLEERFIIPVARELAVALEAVHEAGIIHRDIKSANVMIHENGSLQVIDFGVAGILESKIDKRATLIGTPHWMPPELHKQAPREGLAYGTEVDVWAYGATLYEIATGNPPHHRVEPGRRLGAIASRNAPRLDSEKFSSDLQDLVAFVLETRPANRPSMQSVLHKQVIVNSKQEYPTSSLAELVRTYYRWERGGGQRQSLFMQGGAAALEYPGALAHEEDWNFSLTPNFESQLAHDTPAKFSAAPSSDLTTPDSFDKYVPSPTAYDSFETPESRIDASTSIPEASQTDEQLAPEDKMNNEERVKRGGQAMAGLFDENKAPYKYEVKDDAYFRAQQSKHQPPLIRAHSDLPLRPATEQSSLFQKELEIEPGKLDSSRYDNMPNIDLANVGTIKANRLQNRAYNDLGEEEERDRNQHGGAPIKRATMDWKFPTLDEETPRVEETAGLGQPTFQFPALHVTDTDASNEVPKRATMDFRFPAMSSEGDDNPTPAVSRPALRHMATAPVVANRSSVLDLDELYESDVPRSGLSSGLVSDEEPDPVDLPVSTEFTTPSSPDSEDATTIRRTHYVAENELDPFLFYETSEDEARAKEKINEYLINNGVSDALEQAALRREYLRARQQTKDSLKQDIVNSGHLSATQRYLAQGFEPGYDMYEGGWWTKYDPDTNPAPESIPYPLGAPPRIGEAGFPRPGLISLPPVAGGASTGDKRDLIGFPEPTPPSAAALATNAPPSVVVAEMTRLLESFNHAMGIIGDQFTEPDEE